MLADQKPFPYSSLFPPSFFCTKYYYIIEGRKHPVCIWCVCMLWVNTCAFIPTHLNFLSLRSSSIKGRRIKWENMSRYLLNCCCITYNWWYHHPHHRHGVKTNNGITFLLTDWEEVYKQQDGGGDNGRDSSPHQERGGSVSYWKGHTACSCTHTLPCRSMWMPGAIISSHTGTLQSLSDTCH